MSEIITGNFEKAMLTTLSEKAVKSSFIDPDLYVKYEVKRGLRDLNGRGVLVGLTEIGEVQAYDTEDNKIVPAPGMLLYRGIDLNEIVTGFLSEGRYGFEEVCYLLIFGNLPAEQELLDFRRLIAEYRGLPGDFTRDMILQVPSKDIMNMLSRSVLALYSFDEKADDTSVQNVLRQCLQLIARFPSLTVYGYQALSHYHGKSSLYVVKPKPELSIAENILYMLRPDNKYTDLEAKVLDLALVLYAEHGGGNNSSFITHVATSTGTDTYSVIAAALGSLKGPRHGGVNLKVIQMFDDMKQELTDWEDDEEIKNHLSKLLNNEAFDRKGLIYGIGHAVYSISDPRAVILKRCAAQLAEEKGLEDEFRLYAKVEKLAPEVIARVRKMYKGVSANVDFYSGFAYRMLDIPLELFAPIFAVSRISGWSAHRIEEIVNEGKIIRPAYKSVLNRRKYINMERRKR